MIRHHGVAWALVVSVATFAPRVGRAAPPVRATPLAPALVGLHHQRALADARGRLPVVFDLPPGVDPAEYGARRVAGDIATKWVRADDLPAFLVLTNGLHAAISPPFHTAIDVSGTRWTHTAAAHANGFTGKGVVVGVVDTGIDLNHPDFRDSAGKTRVKWFIDMSREPVGMHPDLEKQFGCSTDDQAPCAILSGDELDAEIAAGGPDVSLDDEGHGTHVTSIAAGNGGPAARFVGGAPEADLIVARVVRDGTITDSDILNATAFVFDRADAMNEPAVVNLSLGGDFGPHDGTSPLERGLNGLVGPSKPGHAVVIAAGNSGAVCIDGPHTWGTHTEVRLIDGETVHIPLESPSGGSGAQQGNAFVWVRYDDGATAKVSLEQNGTTLIEAQDEGQEAGSTASGSTPAGSVVNGVVGGDSPLTSDSRGAIVSIEGSYLESDEFDVVLEGHGLVELWVQGTGDAEVDAPCGGLEFDGALKQGTINTPASAPGLIGVGCSLNRVSWDTRDSFSITVPTFGSIDNPPLDTVCFFSASGPNALGTPKPEIVAPGAYVVAAMSAAADPKIQPNSLFAAPDGICPDNTQCFVVDDTHAIASGTSMSSPQAAGAVALLFQKDKTLTEPELTALLQGGARRIEGLDPFDYQTGPGALDVTGAFNALAEQGQPRALVPDASASWLTMSAGFARPSADFPVTGTLVLRTADGSIADGFDEQQFGLAVTNGSPLGAPSRQGPGLYTFRVIANDASGGETLRVTATYAGAEIASKSLPIAQDVFLTTGTVSARGGCSTAPASEGAPLFTLALTALWARARKRSPRGARTALRRRGTASRARSRRR